MQEFIDKFIKSMITQNKYVFIRYHFLVKIFVIKQNFFV